MTPAAFEANRRAVLEMLLDDLGDAEVVEIVEDSLAGAAEARTKDRSRSPGEVIQLREVRDGVWV